MENGTSGGGLKSNPASSPVKSQHPVNIQANLVIVIVSTIINLLLVIASINVIINDIITRQWIILGSAPASAR